MYVLLLAVAGRLFVVGAFPSIVKRAVTGLGPCITFIVIPVPEHIKSNDSNFVYLR